VLAEAVVTTGTNPLRPNRGEPQNGQKSRPLLTLLVAAVWDRIL